MAEESQTDPATYFQDSPFPGRRLIAWAVGIWAVVILLPGWTLNIDQRPEWVSHAQTILFLPAIPLYFIGFWKAVVGKGYPRILFLISLIPLIGLLILFFLPTREDDLQIKPNSEQAGGHQPPTRPEAT